MERDDIKRRIVDAVWMNPQLVYGIVFKDKGANKKTSIHHPNGEKGKDWSAYALLKKDTTICANWKGSADDDLWQFVMAKESTTFMGAVKYLADIYKIPIELSAKDKEKAVMRSFNEVILHHCNKILREDAIAEDVRQYLAKRGLDISERLGYWSNSVKDDVIRILDRAYVDINEDAIAKRINELFPYNADNYRLIIGRFNGNSLMGFCGRKTNMDADGGKYIYSRSDDDENNNPKGAFVKVTERMVVMEGMLDIESALQKGVNAFATGTSSITLAQTEELVRRGCREFVLIPDCELDEKESQPTELQHIKIRISDQIGKRRMRFVGTSIDRILSVSTRMDEYVSISVSDISRWRKEWDEEPKDVNDYIIAHPNADLMAEILDAKLSWYRYLCEMLAINSDDEDMLARQITHIFGAIPDKSEQNRFAMFVERQMSMGEFAYKKISECGMSHEVFAEIVRKGISRTKSVLTDNYVTEINNAYNGEKMGNSDVYEIAQKLADVRKDDDAMSLYRQLMRPIEDIEGDIAERGSEMPLSNIMLKDDEGNGLRPLTIPPVGIFVLHAMPKHGKTTLLINFARMITAQQEGLVLFLTNEQNQDDMLSKCYCMCTEGNANMSGIEQMVKEAKTGIEENELPTIKNKYGEMFGNVKFARIDRHIDSAVAMLRNSVNTLRRTGKDVSCIVLDYLQLMRYDEKMPRTEQITHIMAQLNDLSNELGICILTASQLNRDVRQKKKEMDDITYADGSDSKAIEEYASEIFLLLNADMMKEDIAKDMKYAEQNEDDDGSPIWRNNRAKRMYDAKKVLDEKYESSMHRNNIYYIENLLSRRNRIGGFASIEVKGNGMVNGQID